VLGTAALTEKGLLESGDVFVAGAILSLAAGLAVGRWRAVGAGPAFAALAVAGIAAGWWGAGLGDRWQTSLVWLALAAAVLTATGVALASVARRFRPLGRMWRAFVSSAALVAIAGFWFVSTRAPDVDRVQARAASTLYYLGDSFEGYRLTAAEEWGGRALFAYGDCEVEFGQGADGGCSVPLQLQEQFTPGDGPSGCGPPPGLPRPKREDPAALLVFAGSTTIEIYAHDRARGRRAARALRPVSRSCS
jgi:hypothetical protein